MAFDYYVETQSPQKQGMERDNLQQGDQPGTHT